MSRKPSSVVTLPNFRLRLLGASAILFILIASFFAWQVHVAALEREASTKIQVQTYARAVSGQLSSTLKTVDLALKGVGHATAMLPGLDSLSELRLRGVLLAQWGTVDSDVFLVASDSEGMAITSSNGVPVRGVSFAERDFFRVHQERSGVRAGGGRTGGRQGDQAPRVGAQPTAADKHRRICRCRLGAG